MQCGSRLYQFAKKKSHAHRRRTKDGGRKQPTLVIRHVGCVCLIGVKGEAMNSTALHPNTCIGLVALTVADLARSVAFYADLLGFRAIERSAQIAVLGAVDGQPLLLLIERPNVRPKPTEATGLYHFAILLPTRADLARAVRHLNGVGYHFQ